MEITLIDWTAELFGEQKRIYQNEEYIYYDLSVYAKFLITDIAHRVTFQNGHEYRGGDLNAPSNSTFSLYTIDSDLKVNLIEQLGEDEAEKALSALSDWGYNNLDLETVMNKL